jgi:hypothetical protein
MTEIHRGCGSPTACTLAQLSRAALVMQVCKECIGTDKQRAKHVQCAAPSVGGVVGAVVWCYFASAVVPKRHAPWHSFHAHHW